MATPYISFDQGRLLLENTPQGYKDAAGNLYNQSYGPQGSGYYAIPTAPQTPAQPIAQPTPVPAPTGAILPQNQPQVAPQAPQPTPTPTQNLTGENVGNALSRIGKNQQQVWQQLGLPGQWTADFGAESTLANAINSKGGIQSLIQAPVPAPTPSGTSTYTGPSIVDYLNSIGRPSDFNSRTQLAVQQGIQNYTGTAQQNTQLLNTLRGQGGGQAPAQPPQAPPAPPQAPSAPPQTPTTPTEPDFQTQVQNIFKQYGISPVSSTQSPLTAYADYYKSFLTQMGYPDIKAQFDTTQKQYTDLQNELQDKIALVNDNPFISEGLRSAKITKLQNLYEAKTGVLNNKLKIYESQFNRADENARFIAGQALTMTHQQQQLNEQQVLKAIELAQNEIRYQREQNKITTHFETDAKGDVIVIGTKPSGETSIIGTYLGKGKPSKVIKEKKDIFKSSKSIIQQYKDNGISREQIEKQYADAGKAIPIEVQIALDQIYPKPATTPSTFHWYNPLSWF